MAVKGGDSCSFLLRALGDDNSSKRLLVVIGIFDVIYRESRKKDGRQRDKGMILVVTDTSSKQKARLITTRKKTNNERNHCRSMLFISMKDDCAKCVSVLLSVT